MIKTQKFLPVFVAALVLSTIVAIAIFDLELSQKYEIKRILVNSPFPISVSPTQPIPQKIALNTDKVALGNRLFHDPRLSANDTISCASCHPLKNGGVDNLPRSIGINGQTGIINAPTVFNSGFNIAQFWDGRAATLEDQIEGPVNNPIEMGSNWQQVIGKLGSDNDYRESFSRIFPDGITSANIKNAIATFERSLVTPDSRFDKFLRGEADALTAEEKNGFDKFQSYGCISCHQGINLGGNMYEKMGLMRDYFVDRGNPTQADNGRFNVTHDLEALHEFRVPSLRNVAKTAPYFHDGTATNLEQAIGVMARYQLGRPMPKSDVMEIAAFLRTLTGNYLGEPL